MTEKPDETADLCSACGHRKDGLSPHPPECAECPEGYCETRIRANCPECDGKGYTESDRCNCGVGPSGYYGMHERYCGLEQCSRGCPFVPPQPPPRCPVCRDSGVVQCVELDGEGAYDTACTHPGCTAPFPVAANFTDTGEESF